MTMATPVNSGYFVLQAEDENSCKVKDSVFVNLFFNYPAYIPNAFSPNADGINDHFTAYSNEAAANINMQIFNRWGSLLYEARQIPPGVEELGWDGTFRGDKVGPGIYVYRIQIQYIDGTVRDFSGDLLLKR
jgi:gliding motility-associated-like protein